MYTTVFIYLIKLDTSTYKHPYVVTKLWRKLVTRRNNMSTQIKETDTKMSENAKLYSEPGQNLI